MPPSGLYHAEASVVLPVDGDGVAGIGRRREAATAPRAGRRERRIFFTVPSPLTKLGREPQHPTES